MKDFFHSFIKKGFIILIIVFAIWFLYFLINFFLPHSFDFLRKSSNTSANNTASTTTSTTTEKEPWNYRVYHMFFGGSKASSTITTNSNTRKVSFWNGSSTTWGGDAKTVWGSNSSTTIINGKGTEQLDNSQVYISPNENKSPIQNMKIGTILIKSNSINNLSSGNIVSGRIFRGFNSQPYFSVYIYDETGKKIFDFPAIPIIDAKDNQYANFTAYYSSSYNYQNYKGKAYMIIRSDNSSVQAVSLVRVNIIN